MTGLQWEERAHLLNLSILGVMIWVFSGSSFWKFYPCLNISLVLTHMGSTRKMVLRLDRFDLVIFNLEVVDTLEIVQGAPFHSHLFRGGWSLIILTGKVPIIRVSCFTLFYLVLSCFTLFERILPSSSSKFSTSGRVRNQKGLWIIHKLNWESQLKIIFWKNSIGQLKFKNCCGWNRHKLR